MTAHNEHAEITLDEAIKLVGSFHQRIQAPIAEKPTLLARHPGKALGATILVNQLAQRFTRIADGDKDLLLSRAAMELEELAEWLLAHAQANLVGVADALGDRLYLLLGDAVATGLPLAELLVVVHESNMSKLGGVHTGLGKGVKGPGYARPRITEVLAQFGCPRQE
jgi:predicted HAD superfamily Cof-like phosphohydrolase